MSRGRKNKGGQFDVCANEINVFLLCEKDVIVGGCGMILFCMQLQCSKIAGGMQGKCNLIKNIYLEYLYGNALLE